MGLRFGQDIFEAFRGTREYDVDFRLVDDAVFHDFCVLLEDAISRSVPGPGYTVSKASCRWDDCFNFFFVLQGAHKLLSNLST